jgi:hypothetical protein
MVRGLRTSATSSTLDDRRPARRSTSYHATAATAIIFRGPYRKPQAAEIQASHCRDDSLLMRGDAQVFLRFLALRSREDLVEADDENNRTILAVGFVFFRSANRRSKGKRPEHWKSAATKVCDSRQIPAEPTIPGTGPFSQRGVQRYPGCFHEHYGSPSPRRKQ